VDLIRNYGIFNKINFSVPTDDFLDICNEFQKQLYSAYFYWISIGEFVSEIITPYGLCFTFNFPKVEDFLNTNSTSNDFHFSNFHTVHFDPTIKNISLPRKISTSINGLYFLLSFPYHKKIIESDIDGLLFFVHDPFELPVKSTPKFNAKSFQPLEIKIDPEINTIDDSLLSYSPEE
jgi:hypothetical protein